MSFSSLLKPFAARLKALEDRLFRKPYLIVGWVPPEKPPGEDWVLEVVNRIPIGGIGEWQESEWRKTKN